MGLAMTRKHDKPKRWQFRLASLLLVVLVVALALANVIPRLSIKYSEAGFVVKHWQRGFPFIYAADVESPSESYGTRNLVALAGDIIVAGIAVALFANRQLMFPKRAGAIHQIPNRTAHFDA